MGGQEQARQLKVWELESGREVRALKGTANALGRLRMSGTAAPEIWNAVLAA